jgi:hypothetical protein
MTVAAGRYPCTAIHDVNQIPLERTIVHFDCLIRATGRIWILPAVLVKDKIRYLSAATVVRMRAPVRRKWLGDIARAFLTCRPFEDRSTIFPGTYRPDPSG